MKNSEMQSGRLVPTGIAGLDDVLLGGIIAGNVVVIEGMPGTGKTNIGLEFLYRGATEFDEPGIFISFETAPEKIKRDASSLGWDLIALEAAGKIRIIHSSPLTMVEELDSASDTLSQLVASISAKRVVIDGLTPLELASDRLGARPYRDSLHMLLNTLRKLDVTPFLTTETTSTNPIGETSSKEEQYLADTVLTLRNQARRRSVHRSIEVAKSRGQDFVTGRHSFKIVPKNGIKVFPRIYARKRDYVDQPTSNDRVSTGIRELDQMLGGGVLRGAMTLVVGISGTGKTVSGMQFLIEGAKNGEKGLLVSLDEHPKQLVRNATNLDLDFGKLIDAGQIFVQYDSPLEVDLDEHFYVIENLIVKNNIKRVVIDSVAAYESSQPKEAREFLVALANYLKSKLIPAYLNFECPELLGISQISNDMKSSAMVDNIILLNYVEISTLIRRAISIPKARGSRPAQTTREYLIQEGGLTIVDDSQIDESEKVPQLPLSSYYSVLGRAPTRHSPIIDESVSAGKPMPKSKLPKVVSRVKRGSKNKKA